MPTHLTHPTPRTYQTAEVAAKIGIHPNTVRLYEAWGLIPKPQRQPNGYRVFTDFHVEQMRLIRIAFQTEILQSGLRKQIIQMLKTAASGDFDAALALTRAYVLHLGQEIGNAEEAIAVARQILSGQEAENTRYLRRKETAILLGLTTDTIRNWEMNGLLTVKRRENGYRVYTDHDIKRLKIIRALKCANYSLAAILRMLEKHSQNPEADILRALNTPEADDEIITACDQLITSLTIAAKNGRRMIAKLKAMKKRFA
jgi:DNA-binding transcriptional MerR regulator